MGWFCEIHWRFLSLKISFTLPNFSFFCNWNSLFLLKICNKKRACKYKYDVTRIWAYRLFANTLNFLFSTNLCRKLCQYHRKSTRICCSGEVHRYLRALSVNLLNYHEFSLENFIVSPVRIPSVVFSVKKYLWKRDFGIPIKIAHKWLNQAFCERNI